MQSFPQYALEISYYDKWTKEIVRTKFLALHSCKPSTLKESHFSENSYVIWNVSRSYVQVKR